jgi:hypothetical protein
MSHFIGDTEGNIFDGDHRRFRLTHKPTVDYTAQIARERIEGAAMVHLFGRNESVEGTEVALWEDGGAFTWPAAAATIDVVSDNAADTAAGTGARTVFIYGLDGSYNEVSETVTLAGTTPVTTVNSYLRVNWAICRTAGTSRANAGVITGTHNDASTTIFHITAGDAEAHQAIYTVPAGKRAYGLSVSAWMGKDADVDVSLWCGQPGYCWRKHMHIPVYQNNPDTPLFHSMVFGEKTDIYFSASRTSGAAAVTVVGQLILAVEDWNGG